MERHGCNLIPFITEPVHFQNIAVDPSQFDADFGFIFVFQQMEQMLAVTLFGEAKKGNDQPRLREAGYFGHQIVVLRPEVVIGHGQLGYAAFTQLIFKLK
jgi:hypothetical protein